MMYSSPQMTATGSYSFTKQTAAALIDISRCQITLVQDSYIYDGIAKQPNVTVTYGANTLIKNKDYTISYVNNISVGTAKVTIKGMGNYTGTVDKEFKILEKEEESTNPGEPAVPEDPADPENPTDPEEPTDPGETIIQKPARVTGLFARPVSATKIKINWKQTTDAGGYRLYRYDNKKKTWKCIKTISKGAITSYTDSKLASATAYKYRICAYAAADQNCIGAFSKSVTTVTKPVKVCIKTVTAKRKAILLKWKKTAGSGYEIAYSTKKNFSGAKTVKVSDALKSFYHLKKLKSNKTYYVKIRAYKKVGTKIYRGAYSAKKKVKIK